MDFVAIRCPYHERLIRLWMRLDKQRRVVEKRKYERVAVLEELPIAGPAKDVADVARVRYISA